MDKGKSSNPDLYYTNDHEWIDYQGAVAYIGVCGFKLSGFKEIHQVQFKEPSGFRRKGTVIATIKYNEYEIEAHMPVDGKIIRVNETLLSGDRNVLLHQPENNGWIALIAPSLPYERKELILPEHYRMNEKK